MFRRLSGWLRLAVVLSGLWLISISLYAGYSWVYADSVDSMFFYRTLPMGAVEAVVDRNPPQGVIYSQAPTVHFMWGWFWSILGGVWLAILILAIGPAWIARGFDCKPASPQA
ncbi:MAG: hypothetical protein U0744_01460 [Gemmataceae bacterium]